ncbi:glycoside hydrolase family 31 protein [Pleomassaria siparia CBS 279.74]|uniref:Probable alpha/beta-glucosidase agdC n=1 Tax=Pleomassaria siparia CBS 279.74 TaxID=1314801 RepID=A0A6G1KBG4_9PLEO|nr:glycoside hydrolase family 31 protein [Pleomassaria siparia CBS 279.74]
MDTLVTTFDYIGQTWLSNNGSSIVTSVMPASVTLFQTSIFFLWSCFLPWSISVPLKRAADCPGYKASNINQTNGGLTADLSLAGSPCNVYGQDLPDLKFVAEYQTDSRLHVIIYDKDEDVYQVPEFVVPRPTGSINADDSLLEVSVVEEPFSFEVTRKSSKEVLFSTKGSEIIFENQYWRLRTSLPDNPSLYGLGEHTDPLRVPTSDYVRTLWARDAGAVPENSNLYGSHPVYYEHRANATHGVLLLNSNGMDIKINTDGGQGLEYNVLGGVIDLYFLAGPSPIDVAREYSEISLKPVMMPYWSFGFHQCRFGYSSVDEVAAVVANFSAANIPLETMWTDIDYMDSYKVFTLGAKFPLEGMRTLVNNLHANDQHYIVMVDPAVAYQDYPAFNNGKDAGIFLQQNGSIYKGRVWPGVTAFPDWFHDKTQGYWDNEFETFFSASDGVDIDGLWIDMNEPSNFCVWPCSNPETDSASSDIVQTLLSKRQGASGSKIGLPGRNLIDPAYQIRNAIGSISNKTARTDLIHYGGYAEYDTHNLYGTMMSKTSRNSMLARRPGRRPLVITRSTYVGAGSYVGHWLGDNVSAWDQYRISIRHLLQFVSFFQVPMVGADVCGFLGSTTETLCARWTVLGAFYPFYRNHNVPDSVPQEPYRWESVAAAARKAIDLRYRLLDYIYTAMHQQTIDGTPMLSPLWFQYPTDPSTNAIDTQFFYGPSLLVSPVTDADSTTVTFYLPSDIFYDLFTLKQVVGTGSSITNSSVPFADIPVHIRGGSIIPARVNSANTTTAVRKEDFELLVATDKDGKASGSLYLDDGDSLVQAGTSDIEFQYDNGKISMDGTFGYKTDVGVSSVTVLGSESAVKYELNEGLDGQWEHDVGSLKVVGL